MFFLTGRTYDRSQLVQLSAQWSFYLTELLLPQEAHVVVGETQSESNTSEHVLEAASHVEGACFIEVTEWIS